MTATVPGNDDKEPNGLKAESLVRNRQLVEPPAEKW